LMACCLPLKKKAHPTRLARFSAYILKQTPARDSSRNINENQQSVGNGICKLIEFVDSKHSAK